MFSKKLRLICLESLSYSTHSSFEITIPDKKITVKIPLKNPIQAITNVDILWTETFSLCIVWYVFLVCHPPLHFCEHVVFKIVEAVISRFDVLWSYFKVKLIVVSLNTASMMEGSSSAEHTSKKNDVLSSVRFFTSCQLRCSTMEDYICGFLMAYRQFLSYSGLVELYNCD